MNSEKSDSGVGAILWDKREHQSLRKVYFKFQSSSSYRTSKVLTWSNWYTLIYINRGFMNPGGRDCGVGAILWVNMMHQGLRKVCFKFQSSSSYGTSKGPMWSNWYTLIYLKNCIKQGFSGPWKDIQWIWCVLRSWECRLESQECVFKNSEL